MKKACSTLISTTTDFIDLVAEAGLEPATSGL